LRSVGLAVTAEGVPLAAKAIGVAVVLALATQPVAWVAHWGEAMAPARSAEAWEDSYAGLEQAFPPNETALYTVVNGQWVALRHPAYLVWIGQVYLDGEGVVRPQLQEDRAGRPDKGFFENVADGPDLGHAVPSWVRRVVVIDGHPLEQQLDNVREGIEQHHEVLPGGRSVTWFDPSGLATIEDALNLFVSATIPPPVPHYPPPSG
jgi:hypothetical protein